MIDDAMAPARSSTTDRYSVAATLGTLIDDLRKASNSDESFMLIHGLTTLERSFGRLATLSPESFGTKAGSLFIHCMECVRLMVEHTDATWPLLTKRWAKGPITPDEIIRVSQYVVAAIGLLVDLGDPYVAPTGIPASTHNH
jgi:hypothetical protein